MTRLKCRKITPETELSIAKFTAGADDGFSDGFLYDKNIFLN